MARVSGKIVVGLVKYRDELLGTDKILKDVIDAPRNHRIRQRYASQISAQVEEKVATEAPSAFNQGKED